MPPRGARARLAALVARRQSRSALGNMNPNNVSPSMKPGLQSTARPANKACVIAGFGNFQMAFTLYAGAG